MADLFALIRLALKDLGRGTVPPSEILKPLISKVSLGRRTCPLGRLARRGHPI